MHRPTYIHIYIIPIGTYYWLEDLKSINGICKEDVHFSLWIWQTASFLLDYACLQDL